jgi:hypothetical protein
MAENPQPGQILRMEVSGGSWWNRQLRRSRVIYLVGRVVTRLTSKGEWGTSRFTMELEMLEGKDSPDIERGWTHVEKALTSLRTLADSHYRVGLVALPCKELVVKTYPAVKYESRVREIASRLGFFVVDPLPTLMATGPSADRLFIPYDRNHLSPVGHRAVAQSIVEAIEAHAILSPAIVSNRPPSRPAVTR